MVALFTTTIFILGLSFILSCRAEWDRYRNPYCPLREQRAERRYMAFMGLMFVSMVVTWAAYISIMTDLQ